MDYEYQRFSLPRSMSRNAVRHALVEAAEHGGWELRRVRIHADGTRRIELRRKIIRVRSTLAPELVPPR